MRKRGGFERTDEGFEVGGKASDLTVVADEGEADARDEERRTRSAIRRAGKEEEKLHSHRPSSDYALVEGPRMTSERDSSDLASSWSGSDTRKKMRKKTG